MGKEQDKEFAIVEHMASVFARNNTEYQQGVYVGGTVPDFYVVSPSTGSSSIFEVKTWEPSPENIIRAQNLAQNFVTASGADHAYIVMDGLPSSDPENGIVSQADLDQVLQSGVIEVKTIPEGKIPLVGELPEKIIFAAMSFLEKYEDTFDIAMQHAALQNDAHCIRVDHKKYTGDVVSMIKQLIQDCIAVIADVSEIRPNVLYEMGYAEGLNKPIVQICSPPKVELPFDIRNNNTIFYNIGQITKLKPELTAVLTAIL